MESRNEMKELERINRKYLKVKAEVEAKKQAVKQIESQLEEKEKDLKILDGVIVLKERKGETAEVEKTKKEKEKVLKEIEGIKENLIDIKDEVLELNEKLSAILEHLKENPKLKQHIEECVAKRCDRENKKLVKEKIKHEKDKEKEEKKIEKVEKIKSEIQAHPHLKNNLQGLLQAKYNMDKLKSKLEALDKNDPSNKQQINLIEKEIKTNIAKYDKNKQLMLDYFKNKKIDFSEKDLKGLEESIVDKNGTIDVEKTLSKNIKDSKDRAQKCEKEIKKLNKKIRINEKSIERLGRKPRTEEFERQEREPNNEENRENAYIDNNTEEYNNDYEEPKLKWYQLIKKFQRWRENRNVKALPENTEKPVSEEQKEEAHKGEFQNSLKYDVVKDMMKEISKQAAKESKAQVREEGKQEENKQEER